MIETRYARCQSDPRPPFPFVMQVGPAPGTAAPGAGFEGRAAALAFGLAGSYTPKLPVGAVCVVGNDQLADDGALDDSFVDEFEMLHTNPGLTRERIVKLSPSVRDHVLVTLWLTVTFTQFRYDELLLYPGVPSTYAGEQMPRSLSIQVPEVSPGTYTLELTIEAPGREPLSVRKDLEVIG